jgi:heme-degrading monooxygenase HmoA
MISRHWSCVTDPDAGDAYEKYLRTSTFPGLAELPGFLSATILRREHDEGSAFRIVTEWESMDAVRGFAGDDVETAVVPEAAQVLMIRFDKRVVHYEVRERVGEKG